MLNHIKRLFCPSSIAVLLVSMMMAFLPLTSANANSLGYLHKLAQVASSHIMTKDELDRLISIEKGLVKEKFNIDVFGTDTSDLLDNINAHPEIHKLITEHGFTVSEYLNTSFTMLDAANVVKLGGQEMLVHTNPKNIEFVHKNQDEVDQFGYLANQLKLIGLSKKIASKDNTGKKNHDTQGMPEKSLIRDLAKTSLNHILTKSDLERLIKIEQDIATTKITVPSMTGRAASVDELAHNLDADPKIHKIVADNGFTMREYLIASTTLSSAASAAKHDFTPFPVNPKNTEFVDKYKAKVDQYNKLRKTADEANGDGDGDDDE